MTARRAVARALAVALLANALLAAGALAFGVFVVRAEGGGRSAGSVPAEPAPAREPAAEATYLALVADLRRQREALDRRAIELEERERQLEVLEKTVLSRVAATAEPRVPTPLERLLRAYEGMDPDNAAAALVTLHAQDPRIVTDLLIGMRSRQAAEVLDAIAAVRPEIAAELSLEVWRRDR